MIEKAANWMLEEIKKHRWLEQGEALRHISHNFDGKLSYLNKNGNLSIAKPVLREFKKRHRGQVVWNQAEQAWYWCK